MSDDEVIKLIPPTIAEWIDDEILPDLADGYHSAEMIVDELKERAELALDTEEEDPKELAEGYTDLSLIYSWLLQNEYHQRLLILDIDRIFRSWKVI